MKSRLSAPQRLLTALALALVVALGVLAWQIDFGRGFEVPEVAPLARTTDLDGRVLPGFALPPIDPQFKETIERPLFTPTRRPAPPGNAVVLQAMRKGQYKLAGTVVIEGSSSVFLFETATNKTHRINLGSEIGGVKVDEITPTRVVLRLGEETEELTLRASTSPKAPPPQQIAAIGQPFPPGMIAQPGGNVLQPGIGAGAAPGTPGGPPLPAGIPGVAGIPPQATSGGFPLNSPLPAAAPPAEAAPAQPVDQNSAATRRRRFQNLPQ